MLSSLIRYVISLLLVAVFLARGLGWLEMPFIDVLENHIYDTRLRLTAEGGIDPRIVIVDVDDRSLASEGQWPWPRKRMATLVNQLFDHYGAGALVFDVVFAEEQRHSGLDTLQALSDDGGDWRWLQPHMSAVREILNEDRSFASALQGRPLVGAYYFSSDSALQRGDLPEPLFVLGDGAADIAVERAGYVSGIGELNAAMYARGFIDNPSVDNDGVYRRAALLQAYDGALYESLALTTARLLLGEPPVGLKFSEDGSVLEAITLGQVQVAVDERAAMLVPYRGGIGSFNYVSATDVLHGKADAAILEGALVLLGSTAPGLSDLRSSPMAKAFPGVEIQANLIAGMLDGDLPVRPDYASGLEVSALFAIGLLLTLLLPRLSIAVAMGLGGLMIPGLAWGNFLAWQQGLALPLASALILLLTLFAFHTAFGFFTETRRRSQLTRVFGRYVPEDLVEEMSNGPEDFALGGESREMTVLFTDVRNFTSLSEGMSAGDLTQMMNAYLTEMTRIIQKYRGTVDKYIGDAVMAFWGAPVRQPDHARLAMRAAAEMIAATTRLRDEFRERGWPELSIGGGINSGIMNVGNMGSEFRIAYTVMGDAVNLASRLEGLTKFYGVSLVVGEGVLEKVPEMVFRELDRVRVKGRALPVSIYELVGERGSIGDACLAELDAYRWALAYYRARDWPAAHAAFLALCRHAPEVRLYGFYRERVEALLQDAPPPDWDGVFEHKSK